MATVEKTHVNTEQGGRRHSFAGDSSTDERSYDSIRSSSESGTEIVGVSEKVRESSVSEGSEEVDLESGVREDKVHLGKVEKDCRICHLSLDASNPESGVPIELGCSCREDLAAAHKQCAEAWFKIKGNRTCEICGSLARNVAGANEAELVEHWNEANDAVVVAPVHPSETRNFWQGHRFLNFLLACMVFAFVISWLFHFNVPS
ncbi:hypothetical protein L1049_011700 [Liquidambar formosana]|uniref:RING-CH-type domain-containing protein n=1 Tax=Liquidambar formosana TaxID=63359 RepID=A0AAP0RX25_LIQFO